MAKTATKSKRRKLNWGAIDEEIEKTEKNNFIRNDGYSENLFTPKLKEDGTHQSIIRFLPRPEGDGILPWVKLFNHGFQDAGGWYIENCPTTLGRDQSCPVCKENSRLWNEVGDEDTAKARGRRTHYFSNVLVITDPQCPENEGKVFIFRYGKTIYDMIQEKMNPADDSIDDVIRVFDYDEGMNFKLKIKPKKGNKKTYNNYDHCEFSGQITALSDDDVDKCEENLFTLGQIIADDKFKSYAELEKMFNLKIGKTVIEPQKEKEPEKEKAKESTTEKQGLDKEMSSEGDDDDENETFFEDLDELKQD